MQISSKRILSHAYGKYIVGGYNVNNVEQITGLFKGSVQSNAPFILQFSKKALEYTDIHLLKAMVKSAGEIFPQAVFAVHLDHGDEETCMKCIEAGFFNSVMIDASDKSFEENITITKRVAEAAHQREITIEAELGRLGGVEEDIEVSKDSAFLANPSNVKEFVEKTKCDSLACAVGTSHGAYKFSGKEALHLDILKEIQQQIPGIPLVVHGASSVPEKEIERINKAGGNIKNAKGVDEKEIAQTAQYGVAKVNLDTDSRIIWQRVHREYFRDFPEDIDFRNPGKIFINEYAQYVAHKSKILKSAGEAKNII